VPSFASHPFSRRLSIRLLTGALSLGLLATASPGAADGQQPRPGSTRSGDSLLPQAGNGGYDVRRYQVTLDYHPKNHRLEATTRIAARAEHPLSSFSLDLQGLNVRRVSVNGHFASFDRRGHKLIITPRSAVRHRFTATVVYGGRAHGHTDPDT
jgi:aminopeptidase N